MIYALCVATAIYLVFASVWDLRERAIYSFPCEGLLVLWGGYIGFNGNVSGLFLFIYFLIGILLYLFFQVKKIWGDGDSELLMLFMLVYLSFCHHFSISELCLELLLLSSALFMAILVSFMEARVKHERLYVNRSVAVAPGLAVVTIGWMIRGVTMC